MNNINKHSVKRSKSIVGITGIATLITLLLVTVFTGCNSKKELVDMNIGLMSDEGAIPFLMAKEYGFFEKEGLNVNISTFKSATDRDSALQAGGLDGAMGDMLAVIFFNQAGFDIKMVSATEGNYKMVTSPNLTEASMKALDKISLGLSSNTVIDYTTYTISTFKGFGDKIEPQVIPQMPVRLEMLGAGEIDGATLPEPLASAALMNGGESVGSTKDFGLYPGVFMVTGKSITEQSENWKKFFIAYNKAVAKLNEKGTTVEFNLLIDRLGFPVVLKDSYKLPVFIPASSPDQSTFEDIAQWMDEKELTKGEISIGDVIDTSLIPQ